MLIFVSDLSTLCVRARARRFIVFWLQNHFIHVFMYIYDVLP
jgi:hypothetical protein